MDLSRLLRAGAAALVAFMMLIANAAGGPLEAERWKSRPLIVFVASASDPLLVAVRSELATPATRAAFDEREIVLYTVVGEEASRGDQRLPIGQAQALRQALADGPGSQTVLVGKDGGVKVRQTGRVDLAAIFTAIDGMPMRRR